MRAENTRGFWAESFVCTRRPSTWKEPSSSWVRLMNSHSNVKKTDILKKRWKSMKKWIILHSAWIDCVNALQVQTKCKTNSSRLLKHTIDMLICLQKQKNNVDTHSSCQKKSFCQIVLTSSKWNLKTFRKSISN